MTVVSGRLCAAVFCLRLAAAAAAEADWERELETQARVRIGQMVRGLDMPASLRRSAIDRLVAESAGPHGALIPEMLVGTLQARNPQMKEGVLETLSRLGGAMLIEPLAEAMRFETFCDVRVQILGLLPVFLLPEEEASLRLELIRAQETEGGGLTARHRRSLRRPPLRASGKEYDPVADQLRRRTMRAVAGQLDPVAAVIVGLESKRRDSAARQVLRGWFARAAGSTRAEWENAWRERRDEWLGPAPSVVKDSAREEIARIQIVACRTLAEAGAEGTEELIEGMRWTSGLSSLPVREATLDALEELATLAAAELPEQSAAIAGGADGPAGGWRRRRIASARAVIDLAHAAGLAAGDDPAETLRAAAAGCLGAGGPPADEADRRRRDAAVTAIRMRLDREGSMIVRGRLLRSLGALDGPEAVRMIAEVFRRRSYSEEVEARRTEAHELKAAAAALGMTAARGAPDTGTEATESLLAALSDERPLPGAPRRDDGTPLRLRDLAREQLELLTGVREDTFDAARWRTRCDDVRLKSRVTGEEGP